MVEWVGTGGQQLDPSLGSDPGSLGDMGPTSGAGFGSSALGLGALALGAGGLGYMISKGPAPIPAALQQEAGYVPYLSSTGANLQGEGQTLINQGTSALDMARRGELTPEQQASLNLSRTGLTNQARQMFSGMGRNPDADTAYLGASADIEARVTAMAQNYIQSTIQLATSELSAGQSLTSQGLQEISAATTILQNEASAQLAADKDYTSALTSVFGTVGSMAGTIVGSIYGGPVGGAVGGAGGSALGRGIGSLFSGQ